jgi:uncharacterized protein
VAILGLLPVHIGVFSGTDHNPTPDGGLALWWEEIITLLVMLVFEGKMLTLLAILFGAGMAIQADNAASAGKPFVPYFCRRMLILFLLGIGHTLFLFQYDILTSYAVAGVIALLFLKRTQKTLLCVATGCFAWCSAWIILFMVLVFLFGSELDSTLGESDKEATPVMTADVEDSETDPFSEFFSEEKETRLFRHGSIWEMTIYRGAFLAITTILFWFLAGWYMLACLLVGIWLARKGVFHEFEQHRGLCRKMTVIGLALGVLFHLLGAVVYLREPEGVQHYFLVFFGMMPLALVHLCWLSRWAHSDRAPWLQAHLIAVGRMALSNYLMQSLLCGIVFYSYGFGFYREMERTTTFLVVLAVWLAQLILSPVWMARFKIGPVEWLWRRLTDGRGTGGNASA